ncbi:E3 ubiquitin-protein ligase WAV3 isoform X1 [Rosa chinensis]|uniref:E3 ubiquitin-protein ligase WAV3 isoform X1 n=1 Tax=Rosa chinensis TaxID=74649 RepID=UPI001AD8B925|nr:E3 ubiquitin-protein ligase WAV3 isoform X1 [Rosa chinensis]
MGTGDCFSPLNRRPFLTKNCAICWSNVTTGQGQAIFTAECSHSFHYPCIANNVQHGNLCCPICRAKWDKNNVPFQVPPLQQNNLGAHGFADDEPLPFTSPAQSSVPQNVTIKTHTETSAIPAADSRPQYPVLVSICAPPLQDPDGEVRTPIDLVTVLDVSGSMQGQKLHLVKQAIKFVIENMGSSDRLSIVSFSTNSRRVLPLRRMTVDGRESAIEAVESLVAGGGTDIAEGLKKGTQVLEDRRQRNPVASIILLSDGQDNYCRSPSQMLKKLPASIRSSDMQHEIPVHTFGFGNDHDAKIMHAISEESRGTFSYIESVGMIQDAFALCIGGLLSVVAQELRLTVRSASHGAKIVSIPSGRYVSQISDDGSQGLVDIGNMYAEEVKQFLVYLLVPQSSASETKTSLVDVLCVYRDLASNEFIQLQSGRVEISRPQFCSPTELAVCLEVDRQRNRLLVADAIGEAQRLAEMGNLEGAREILTQRRETLLASAAAKAGDSLSNMFETELKEIRDKMASMKLYEEAGRAYALAGMSSHSRQRASARGNAEGSCLAMKGRKQLATKAAGRASGGRGVAVTLAAGGFGGKGGPKGKRSAMDHLVAAMGDSDEDDDMGFALCDGGSFDGGNDVHRGAFETPAMVRMVQKSQQKNQSK